MDEGVVEREDPELEEMAGELGDRGSAIVIVSTNSQRRGGTDDGSQKFHSYKTSWWDSTRTK
jgi:hypothetical protein